MTRRSPSRRSCPSGLASTPQVAIAAWRGRDGRLADRLCRRWSNGQDHDRQHSDRASATSPARPTARLGLPARRARATFTRPVRSRENEAAARTVHAWLHAEQVVRTILPATADLDSVDRKRFESHCLCAGFTASVPSRLRVGFLKPSKRMDFPGCAGSMASSAFRIGSLQIGTLKLAHAWLLSRSA